MPMPHVLSRALPLALVTFAAAAPVRAQQAPVWPPAGCPASAIAPNWAFVFPPAAKAAADTVARQYRKLEVCIPMRDGARLFTSIYLPRDTAQRWPIIMERTPYSASPYGPDIYRPGVNINRRFSDDGYVFVVQDVRGRFMSEGYYSYMTPNLGPKRKAGDVDESTDTYDTIEWLLKNVPNNNGRVGLWGISAPGMMVAASMIDAHPALVAASPQAPMIDWYMGDDRHKHGAFTLAQTFNFLQNFARARPGPTTSYGAFTPQAATDPDGYRFFLEGGSVRQLRDKYLGNGAAFFDSIMAHPNYDEFWRIRSLGPQLANIKPAVLWVGGWYDGEDPFGPLEGWRQMNKLSAGTERYIAIGPWWHGGWNRGDGDTFGQLQFGQKTAAFYRDSVEFPFYSCKLKNRCDVKLATATVFETGANRWHAFDAWPPKTAEHRTLYLQPGGKLGFEKPGASAAPFDQYVSDPAHPVPYTMATSFGYYRFYPTEDQRFAAARPDVLVYETAPLDHDVTLAGPLDVTLHVSSTGTDADFITKVIDVYPNTATDPAPPPNGVRYAGMQQLVKGDVMRARWRRDYAKPVALAPNRPDSVSYRMNDVYHTFLKGHRIMVQVQSTWFPLIDRNPQTFVPNIYEAKPADFKPATMRVYHTPAKLSRIDVLVMP